MSNEEYKKIFYDVIRDIITGDNGTLANCFDGTTLGILAKNKDLMWQVFTEFMSDEGDETNCLGHYGIRDKDFKGKETVAKYIGDRISLEGMSKAIDKYEEHWNESFASLASLYKDLYLSDGAAQIGDSAFTIKDVLNSDAGYSFSSETEWTRPNKNISGQTYSQVRANDKIKRILNNKAFMQFTQGQNINDEVELGKIKERLCRLLMPEYQRTVQIEDLDRNFWVIGGIIAGICEFLFDANSPLNKIFDGLLDEITQIWENLFYLWMGAIVLTWKTNSREQGLFVPLNNDVLRPYKKFDNFNDTDISKMLSDNELISYDDTVNVLKRCHERLSYFEDVYNDSSLAIIPEIRLGNYQTNYYSKAYYPGIIVVLRQTDIASEQDYYSTFEDLYKAAASRVDYYYIPFSVSTEAAEENKIYPVFVDMCSENKSVKIGERTFTSFCGVYELDNNYYLSCPYNESTSGKVPNGCYVAGVRTDIEKFSFKTSTAFDNRFSFDLKINFYDVGSVLTESHAAIATSVGGTWHQYNGQIFVLDQPPVKPHEPIETLVKITRGNYRGEYASWQYIEEPVFDITIKKTWADVNPDVMTDKDKKITVQLMGSNGELQEKTVEYKNKNSETLYFQNLRAYTDNGEVIKYTVKETDTIGTDWVDTYENKVISYESTNKTAKITNTWTKINYNGEVEIINMTDTSASIDAFVAKINSDDGTGYKHAWRNEVQAKASKLSDNSAKVYFSHFNHLDNLGRSIFECTPYVSLAIKLKNKNIRYYHYDVKVSGGNSIHGKDGNLAAIPFPYISSVLARSGATYDMMSAQRSTLKLIPYDPKYDFKPGEHPTIPPATYDDTQKRYYVGPLVNSPNYWSTSAYPLGNIVVRPNRLDFTGGTPYLYNFIIYAIDRACAGFSIDTPPEFLFPYYYKCEIKNGDEATENKFGIVTATYEEYNKGANKRFYWADYTKEQTYLVTPVDKKIPQISSSAYTKFENGKVSEFCKLKHIMIKEGE